MARAAAPILALGCGAAAWALLGTVEFDGLLVLGALSLLAAILTLGQPLPRKLRIAVVAVACATLLGTTGLEMRATAGSFRPFSTWAGLNQKDLVELTLPVASEGEPIPWRPLRIILYLNSWGQIEWKSVSRSVEELDYIFDRLPRGTILIRCDKDLPFAHLGWLAVLAAARGYSEVRLMVRRFGTIPDDEALGVEMSGEHWPELEMAFPIAASDGPRLRLEATELREGLWPPRPPPGLTDDAPRSMQPIATGVRYRLGEHATDDLKEVARWIRDTPPRSIEVGLRVPVKYVVAAENEIRKAGLPPAALVLPAPLPASLRQAKYLPYPASD